MGWQVLGEKEGGAVQSWLASSRVGTRLVAAYRPGPVTGSRKSDVRVCTTACYVAVHSTNG